MQLEDVKRTFSLNRVAEKAADNILDSLGVTEEDSEYEELYQEAVNDTMDTLIDSDIEDFERNIADTFAKEASLMIMVNIMGILGDD